MEVQTMTPADVTPLATASAPAPGSGLASNLRLVSIPDVNTALGVAARLTMSHPAFSQERFGDWMRVLDGQAARGHQIFVMNSDDRAVGYLGYIFVDEISGMKWLSGAPTSFYDCGDRNDCVMINAWVAENRNSLSALLYATRKVISGRKSVVFKRYLHNGRYRATRLAVNQYVERHIARFEQSMS